MRFLIVIAVLSAFLLGGVLGAGIYSVTADETVHRETETGSACNGNLLWASDGGWSTGEKEKFLAQFTPEYCAKLLTCEKDGNTERCPRPLDYPR